VRANLR